MNLMKCPNGHHYDASRFSSCPFCGMEGVNVGPDQTTVPLDVPVSQPGPSVATEPLSTAIPDDDDRTASSAACCSDKLSWDFGADIDQRKPDAVPAPEGRCTHSMHGRAVPLSAGQHYVQNFGRDGKSETGGGTDGQNGTCCSRRAR